MASQQYARSLDSRDCETVWLKYPLSITSSDDGRGPIPTRPSDEPVTIGGAEAGKGRRGAVASRLQTGGAFGARALRARRRAVLQLRAGEGWPCDRRTRARSRGVARAITRVDAASNPQPHARRMQGARPSARCAGEAREAVCVPSALRGIDECNAITSSHVSRIKQALLVLMVHSARLVSADQVKPIVVLTVVLEHAS